MLSGHGVIFVKTGRNTVDSICKIMRGTECLLLQYMNAVMTEENIVTFNIDKLIFYHRISHTVDDLSHKWMSL